VEETSTYYKYKSIALKTRLKELRGLLGYKG